MYDSPAPCAPLRYKFTGKERDTESGLDNFGARYNACTMGRFMSADPLGGSLANPQSLNKQTYVLNNLDLLPVFRTSPSMISDEGKGNKHVGEQAYRSPDHRGIEANRGGAQSGRRGTGSRRVEAHDLCVEGEVRWDGCERG
jgi:RHS repeat-associated protein